MVYNKYELKTRDEEGVSDVIPEIEDGKNYWVYSFIVRKVKRRYQVVYDVEPREATAYIKGDSKKALIVMKKADSKRFTLFSAYGRQLYFADTAEEAESAYKRLKNKTLKNYPEIEY